MEMIAKSSFTEAFIRLNGLGRTGFRRWTFQPGMEFKSLRKWWERVGARPAPHEGLDICCFETGDGQVVYLRENSLVPVLYNGRINRIFPDLLGSSILVSHDIQLEGRRLFSIYAHTAPVATLQCGEKVKAGEPIATICPTGKESIRPHLHLSVVRALETAIGSLDWRTINKVEGITICDPLDFL